MFYTDGIMEETDASMTMYGQNRLTGSFQACIEKNTNPVLPRILGDFKQFTKKDRYDDDITILLLEF